MFSSYVIEKKIEVGYYKKKINKFLGDFTTLHDNFEGVWQNIIWKRHIFRG